MAEHLASIFGTEKDRVNCPFYFMVGACRHGDRCSRLHTKPSISRTLLLSNMYQRPDMITPGFDAQGQPIDRKEILDHFEDFYEDLFEKLYKYGEIERLNVCDNLADHMVGNVYVQFREEEHAANALKNLTGRFYAGRPIIVDFSPVTDFCKATCRQYEEEACNRGGYCNFIHVKMITSCLRHMLFRWRSSRHSRRRSRSRSRSPYRHYRYGLPSHGSQSRSRRYDDDDHHESRSRRRRSTSPRSRVGRSRSPGGRRNCSPIREGSEERRAKIALWNKKEEADHANELFRRHSSRHSRSRSRGRGRSRSRSRSRSPYRHCRYDFLSHGSQSRSRRYGDDDHHESRSRRRRSTSPRSRVGRSRSPGGRRNCSPIREGSEERRAKIALWNKKEEADHANELFRRHSSRHSRSRSRSRGRGRSRSRSRSPYRHCRYDFLSHGSQSRSRRYGDDDHHESRSRRRRSTSPRSRVGRSRSPGGRRNCSPIREGSEERRAKIALWNKKEEADHANSNANAGGEHRAKNDHYDNVDNEGKQ